MRRLCAHLEESQPTSLVFRRITAEALDAADKLITLHGPGNDSEERWPGSWLGSLGTFQQAVNRLVIWAKETELPEETTAQGDDKEATIKRDEEWRSTDGDSLPNNDVYSRQSSVAESIHPKTPSPTPDQQAQTALPGVSNDEAEPLSLHTLSIDQPPVSRGKERSLLPPQEPAPKPPPKSPFRSSTLSPEGSGNGARQSSLAESSNPQSPFRSLDSSGDYEDAQPTPSLTPPVVDRDKGNEPTREPPRESPSRGSAFSLQFGNRSVQLQQRRGAEPIRHLRRSTQPKDKDDAPTERAPLSQPRVIDYPPSFADYLLEKHRAQKANKRHGSRVPELEEDDDDTF